MTKYLSVTEAAKLVRAALKESFPGAKFSVRCDKYAGGSSMRIRWTDGPTAAAVESVAKVFEGSYFDGMIDYKGSIYHLLDGERVKFLGDFIFCDRDRSDALTLRAIDAVLKKYRADIEAVAPELLDRDEVLRRYSFGELHNVTLFGGWSARDSLQSLINFEVAKRCPAEYAVPKPSKTLDRVAIEGSDGYGQSGIPARDGVEGKGYPRHEREPGGIAEQQGQMRGLAKHGDPFKSIRLVVDNDGTVH